MADRVDSPRVENGAFVFDVFTTVPARAPREYGGTIIRPGTPARRVKGTVTIHTDQLAYLVQLAAENKSQRSTLGGMKAKIV